MGSLKDYKFWLNLFLGKEKDFSYKEYLLSSFGVLGSKIKTFLKTISGTILSFDDGVAKPAVSLIAHFEPVQEGEGDPSPDNIRPIHGWTGLDINTQHGTNLFDKTNIIRGQYFSYTGNFVPSDSYGVGYIPVIPGQTIVYSGLVGGAGSPCGIGFFDAKKNLVSTYNNTQGNKSFIVPTGASFASISVAIVNNRYYDLDTAQAQLGTVATPYEPYNGTTTSISWQTKAGEIYDGYVDVTRGKMVAEWGIVNLSLLNWLISGNRFRSNTLSGTIYPPETTNIYPYIVCEKYSGINSGVFLDNYPNRIAVNSSGTLIMLYQEGDETPSGNMAYKLLSPIEYDITPQQIALLKGYNNIWNSAGGNNELTYIGTKKGN